MIQVENPVSGRRREKRSRGVHSIALLRIVQRFLSWNIISIVLITDYFAVNCRELPFTCTVNSRNCNVNCDFYLNAI